MKIGTPALVPVEAVGGGKTDLAGKSSRAARIPRCAHDTPTRAIGIKKVPWQAGLSLKTRPRRGEAKHRAVPMRLRRPLHKTAGARKIEQHPKLRLFMESVPYASASTSIICANGDAPLDYLIRMAGMPRQFVTEVIKATRRERQRALPRPRKNVSQRNPHRFISHDLNVRGSSVWI
jgi:hypothetical protein